MASVPHYDVAMWQTHVTENDCDLIIRTNNGRVFYCHLCPPQFIRSPKVTQQYFKCINLFRSGEEVQDSFFVEDACDWLSASFAPLINELAPSSLKLPGNGRVTLSDYLFAPYFWTGLYQESDVELCYDSPNYVLIKPPSKVVHAKNELMTIGQIAKAHLPPPAEARVCHLHGVVLAEKGMAGMLFSWIDKKAVLGRALAEESPVELRLRWASQIRATVEWLHECGIIWGDVKAANVLIDREDNAWVIDFGGSYTVGWVDKEKAGTLEGDMQGFEKIMEMLN
ncbi:hypothetical protein F5B17DRAFT_447347 [Nemania serpens]|nr:hypothetical protein F5B17DRAFT_447347 [Nemania serpens]